MFDDFDSMDMYGFLDYLEESTNINNEYDVVTLEESLGIYEDLSGKLQIEEDCLYNIMENHNLTEEEATCLIMESYEEGLCLMLSEQNASDAIAQAEEDLKRAQEERAKYEELENNYNQTSSNVSNMEKEVGKAEEDFKNAQGKYTAEHQRGMEMSKEHATKLDNQAAGHKKQQRKNAATSALGGAALVGAGLASHKLYKAHKARKEAEARRKRGLMGKIRRLREDYGIFEDEYGELFIEGELVEYVEDYLGIYSEDFIDSTLECYLEDLNDIIDGTLFNEDIDMILEGKDGRGMGGKPRHLVTAQTTNYSSNHSSGGSGGSQNFFQGETNAQKLARIKAKRKGKSEDKTDKAENIVNNPLAQSFEEPKNPEIDPTQAGEQTVEQRQHGKGKRSHRAPKDYTVKKYSNGTKKLSRKQKKAIAKAQANGQQKSGNSNTPKTQITTTAATPLKNNNTPKEVKEIVQQRFEDNNIQTPQQRKEERQQRNQNKNNPNVKVEYKPAPEKFHNDEMNQQIEQKKKENQEKLDGIKKEITNTNNYERKVSQQDLDDKNATYTSLAAKRDNLHSSTSNLSSKTDEVRAANDLNQIKYGKQLAQNEDDFKKRQTKVRVASALGGAAAVGAGYAGYRAYKAHKARKEAEARRNRGLRGKLRRLREGEDFMLEEKYGIFENEYGELFIESEMVEYVMDKYDLYEEDAIDLIMECYEEELLDEAGETVEQKEQISRYYAGMNPKNNPKKPSVASRVKGLYTDAQDAGKRYKKAKVDLQNAEKIGVAEVDGEYRDVAAKNFEQKQEALKKARKDYAVASAKAAAPGALAIGGAAGAVIAHKAYKNHKAKKEAEAKRNRGLRGKLRRLREDYGIFENEYGDLFIENEMIDYVMDEFNLYEEDAIDLIMESYEEELDYLLLDEEFNCNPVNKANGGKKSRKKHLREDSALNVAHAVSSDSHYHADVDAYKLYRQAEMDEGDADRNLARGGKHVLGGIRQAPRSEQDQAGRNGVRFKNRVDDGDMDGEFIDSDIQKPMGAGRRIAENSDMGF